MRRLAVTALAWASLAAPAHGAHLSDYDETVRCPSKAVHDVQVVERSSEAVVFRKLRPTENGPRPVSYACAFRTDELRQSIWRLDDPEPSRRAVGARLAGVFVAYRLVYDTGPDPYSEMVVKSLLTSDTLSSFPKPEESDSSSTVASFVVKRNGSIAWIGVGHPSGEQGVWKVDADDDWLEPEMPRLDASPPAIDTRSIRLSADRRRVMWRRAGESAYRSAPLR
jgi:hypothetical protein